jgi:hypothetical protein
MSNAKRLSEISKDRETYAARAMPYDFGEVEMLGNPALDKVVTCMVAMASEMWATKRRLLVVESLLEQKGISSEAVSTFVASEQQQASWEEERDRFIDLALSPLSDDVHQPLSSDDNGFTHF